MLDNMALMQMQAQTLFRHDDEGCMTTLNEPGSPGDPAPRFFVGRTEHGTVRRYRQDLPDEIIERMDSLAANDGLLVDPRVPSKNTDEYRRILEQHAPVNRVWSGPAYCFADVPKLASSVVRIAEENVELVRELDPDLDVCQPCVAVLEGGRAVALCQSVRVGPRAHEAGVDTLAGYRRRGYATAATAGWARAVVELGRIPLYSTSWENVASQGVARKLGLVVYGVDLHFT